MRNSIIISSETETEKLLSDPDEVKDGMLKSC